MLIVGTVKYKQGSTLIQFLTEFASSLKVSEQNCMDNKTEYPVFLTVGPLSSVILQMFLFDLFFMAFIALYSSLYF